MIKKTIQPKHLNSRYYDIISNDSTFDFFNVRLEDRYGFGLNSFSIRPTNLLSSSQIEIEILDSENKPLYHEISDIISSDNSRLITIYIYPETKLGQIKFYVAGITKNNQSILWTDTRTLYGIETISAPIYKEFPSVLVVEQQIPEYVNLSGSNIVVGDGKFPLKVVTQPNPQQINLNVSNGYTIPFIDYRLSDSVELTKLQIGNRNLNQYTASNSIFAYNSTLNNVSDYSIVTTSVPYFIRDMVGGMIKIDLYNYITASYNQKIFGNFPDLINATIISRSIINVIDEYTATVKPKIEFSYSGKIHVAEFNNLENYTASYYASYYATNTTVSQSHLYIQFNNLQPLVGQISAIDLYIKNRNSLNDYQLLDTVQVKPVELLIDVNDYEFSPTTGINYIRPGFPTTETSVSSSWNIEPSGNVTGSFNVSDSTSKYGSIYVSSSAITTNTYINLSTKYEYDFVGLKNNFYTFSCNVIQNSELYKTIISKHGIKESAGIEFYISGSQITTENIVPLFVPLSQYGHLIATSNTNKNINTTFSVKDTAKLKLFIIIRGSHWRIRDVTIKPYNQFGFTSNTFYCTSKVPRGFYNTEIDLKIIFKNGDKSTEPLYIKKYYINGNV